MKKTLIICDIDNTILKYYDIPYEFINKLVKEDFGTLYDDKEFIKYVNEYVSYYKLINYKKIIHTDNDGFVSLIEKLGNDSEICFLTARKSTFKEKTIEQLSLIGINTNKYDIYYTDGCLDKGDYILKNMSYIIKKYENIIFIDDYKICIESVKKHFPQIKCFQFIIDNIDKKL